MALSAPSIVLERLSGLKVLGRLAHAYLFSGPAGIGKFDAAIAVAKMVNCLDLGGFKPGCVCVSCRKIGERNHPDLFIIETLEDKKEIGIDQVRALMSRLGLRAIEARVKVAIICEAHLLGQVAANAFLKTLEEPRKDTLLILTTAEPGNVLPTVVSRCHEVRLFPVGNSVLAERLKSEYDVPPVEAEILARFSGGSPGRAAALGKAFIERRNACLDEFLLGPAADAMLKKYAADREAARELCEVLLTFYRDVLCFKSGAGKQGLYHPDRIADIERVAARMTPGDIDQVIRLTVKAMEASGETFNMKVALTVLKEHTL